MRHRVDPNNKRSKLRVHGLIGFALMLMCVPVVNSQTKCPDPPTSCGTYKFRQRGDTVEIPLSESDSRTVALELRWSNGNNNGTNLNIVFFDSDDQPIYAKVLSCFLSGSFEFPFATLEPQPWLGSRSLIMVPVKAKIEAVWPFAAPASISYKVVRVASRSATPAKKEQESADDKAPTGSAAKPACTCTCPKQ